LSKNRPTKAEEVSPATVLVVEDEELLRQAVAKALRRQGLIVIEAGDGIAALELLRVQVHELDVILLDMSVPGAPSRQIFEEAKRLRSDLKVILTSAHPRHMVEASFEGLRIEQFIRKPFHLAELVSLFRDTLGS
jgi:DNA-binding NtrC family response regulator